MPVDNTLAYRQPQPGAFVFLTGVDALKEIEDSSLVLAVDADAIVSDTEMPASIIPFCADMNDRIGVLAAKLDGVGNQVLHQQAEQAAIPLDDGQVANQDFGLVALDQVGQGFNAAGSQRLCRKLGNVQLTAPHL